ncbi:MAG: YceI family protein [Flavobacteriales bacterium]|jgi:polyisoprenoid-binding protein YceI
MKNLFFLFAALLGFSTATCAQKYFTRTAHIDFYSHTSIEDIKAENNSGTLVIDAATGQIEVACTIKAFEFEKALMQEHFNENYMESNTYPNATFKGKLENISSINFTKPGSYTTKATGTLTMHGVEQAVSVPVTITVEGDKITGETRFVVNPNDYKINIPGPVKGKISEAIEVKVKANLAQLKK